MDGSGGVVDKGGKIWIISTGKCGIRMENGALDKDAER